MTAPSPKAHCRPPTIAAASLAPPSASEAARLERIVIETAVPMAPATCWVVPSREEPWEYRCIGSAPRPRVKTGVKMPASEIISSTWMPTTAATGVVSPISARAPSATTMPTAPGTTSGRLPTRSKVLPTCGPSRPIMMPPGATTRPVVSGERPRTSCR